MAPLQRELAAPASVAVKSSSPRAIRNPYSASRLESIARDRLVVLVTSRNGDAARPEALQGRQRPRESARPVAYRVPSRSIR